jgi:4-hydroxyphenylpyruvate dioxygenase
VGGSLIHFIEEGRQKQVWELNSRIVPASPPVASRWDFCGPITSRKPCSTSFFLAALCVTLFDVSKTPQVEIADTLGLVRARLWNLRTMRCVR